MKSSNWQRWSPSMLARCLACRRGGRGLEQQRAHLGSTGAQAARAAQPVYDRGLNMHFLFGLCQRRIEIFFLNQLMFLLLLLWLLLLYVGCCCSGCCSLLFEQQAKVQSKLLKFLFKVLYAHATASQFFPPPSISNFKGSCCLLPAACLH